jgi:hypothetical protein
MSAAVDRGPPTQKGEKLVNPERAELYELGKYVLHNKHILIHYGREPIRLLPQDRLQMPAFRDALNKSTFVIPAKAGIQLNHASGRRLRRGDDWSGFH